MEHQHFFSFSISSINTLTESYNLGLVIVSYLVATLAGFCTSSISQYVSIQPNSAKTKWLMVFGGLILGLGIWCMHFIGMLAFSIPIPVKYDVFITVISIIPAVVGAIFTLFFVHLRQLNKLETGFAGLMLASGIAFMHFVGMAAMNMNAVMVHNPYSFVLSILLSWFLATITIQILRNQISFINKLNKPITKTLIASTTFGFSVATMHYLAMQSAYFVPFDHQQSVTGMAIDSVAIAVIISVITILASTAVVLAFKKKIYVLDSLAQKHQTYMAETIDNMSDPFVLTDANGKILLINHSFYRNFHQVSIHLDQDTYSNDLIKEFVEKVVWFNGPEDKENLHTHIYQKKPYKFKDQEQRWWLFRQKSTYSNNQILTWTNITQQTEQNEELLKAKDNALTTLQELHQTQGELAEAKKLASITKLVANVAHELNTPLGVAVTSLSGLQAKVKEIEELVSSQKLSKSALYALLSSITDYEALATRNVYRATNIIQQFKYISIADNNESPKQFELSELIHNVKKSMQQQETAKNVELSIVSSPQIYLESYPDALYQVIKAMVDNALVHAFVKNEMGKISIKVEQINTNLRIEISDDGRGVPESVIEELFEPFVSTKRFEGSVGLGLHVAYNIITYKLKGKIELSHSSIEGSTFTIELPINLTID